MQKYLTALSIVVLTVVTGACASQPQAEPEATGSAAPQVDWVQRMAYQRGLEAINWSVPAVSMIRFREAYYSLGGGLNTVYYLTQPPTPVTETLTANNQTPYATLMLSTREGPVVLEVPPASAKAAIFGSAVDIWQVPLADVGPAGTDQGMGGRYLFLPPDFTGDVPEGFFPVPMDTYNIFVALRLIPLGGAGFTETAEYARKVNAYPLSQADNPPAGEYIDIYDRYLPTLPVYDMSIYTDILTVLNEEPLLERDKVMGGMLASIGIEKGKPFQPNDTVRQALNKAAGDSKKYLDYLFGTPGYAFETRWPDRQWMDLRVPSADGFVFDEGEYLLLDARAAMFHFVTFAPRRLGKATAYIAGTRDADGMPLSGAGSYRLTVPADVPVRDFWSIIAYSMDTKSFIYNDLNRVGLSSFDAEEMAVNEDGSVDIYLGAEAPEGLAANWIPTAGEDFFLLFRFYGPEEDYFNKSFKLPDLERLE